MLIKNAEIHNAIVPEPFTGDILIRGGKLAAVGGTLAAEEGEEVIDASGLRAYPGFIDAHSHIGLDYFGGPTGGAGDVNEKTDTVSPHMRAIDGYYPGDKMIPEALAGGVTTVATGPGSSDTLGGTFMAVKLYGNCVDKSVVRNPVAMKCAFGENPKHNYKDKSNATRMSNAARLRACLYQTREYLEKKEAANGDPAKMPKWDMKLEAMIPVIKGEIPLKAHAHRDYDMLTAIRIAKEFGVKLTLEHCTEGHLIVEELKEAGYPCAVGPTMCKASKTELVNKSWETAGILSKAGIQVSIITDAPVSQQQYLPICAGLCVKAGMDPFAALQAITINPARHIGIEDRVGSLEAGKDADIVLCEGDPLYTSATIRKVIVDGKLLVEK